MKCFICNQPYHEENNCNAVHYFPNKIRVLKEWGKKNNNCARKMRIDYIPDIENEVFLDISKGK